LTAPALEVFRIVTRKRAADAFSGEGARLYGGRWNPKGVRVAYTASSRALAMLEMLVQDQPLRAKYVIIAAWIPSIIRIERVSPSKLPDNWQAAQHVEILRQIGADWIRRGRTAVLCVPSAVVPQESNYLLNPAHPDFNKIKLGKAEVLKTDRRLARRFAGAARRKPTWPMAPQAS
jgi:RES domain-containing protein